MADPVADEQLRAELHRLRAENIALKARAQKGLSLTVTNGGDISVSGFGFPSLILPPNQWRKLFDIAEEIRSFLKEHEAELRTEHRTGEQKIQQQKRGRPELDIRSPEWHRLSVQQENEAFWKRVDRSKVKLERADSTEGVTPETLAEASEVVSKILALRKKRYADWYTQNWYEGVDPIEVRKVDPYWVGYWEGVSYDDKSLRRYYIAEYFKQIAERHSLFTTARDGLIIPRHKGILKALCRALSSVYTEWQQKGQLIASAPFLLVRGSGSTIEFALFSDLPAIQKYTKTLILLSGRNTQVQEPGRCNECGKQEAAFWRYPQSNQGVVQLCERCKPIVYDRSFSNKRRPPTFVSGGAFEMNRRKH